MMFKRAGAGAGGGGGARFLTIPSILLFFLVAYFLGSWGMHNYLYHSKQQDLSARVLQTLQRSMARSGAELDETELQSFNDQFHQKGCDSIEAFIEDGNYDDKTTENPWKQMKWGLPPATCRVNGQLIERLDPSYNFRRGVALGFTEDLDDKTHLELWFLGSKVDLNKRKRRVYIDLGANYFPSSLLYIMQRYPCDFTEVHAFEMDTTLLVLPEGFDEESNSIGPNEHGWKKVRSRDGYIPSWMVKRMHTYNKYAADRDDNVQNWVNITRFIKNELKLTKDDTVVVKMDIEGSEWPILAHWLKDPEMPKIVDELWVELHYYHPDNRWESHRDRSREQANRMLAELRFNGFYAHYWD